AELLLEARQLAQVDRAPQPPREEARELEAEHLRHAGALADGRELAQATETKRPLHAAPYRGRDVARHRLSLAQGVLGGRRMRAAAAVGNRRAIAERPYAGPAGHRELFVHVQAAAIERAGQRAQQRV